MRFAALLLALVPLAFAGWTAFCGDMSCPNVAIDITCSHADKCYLAGGYSNTPMSVYTSSDYANWELANVKGFTAMLMSIAAHPAGSVAAGGFGGGNYSAILASYDGETFYNSKIASIIVGQDLKAIRNNATDPSQAALAFVANVLSTGKDAIYFTTNGGESFAPVALPEDLHALAGARYGAYPSANTWYVTAGTWPTSRKTLAADTLNHCLRVTEKFCQPAADLSAADVRAFNQRRTGHNGGYVGAIAKTTNMGKSWEIVYETNELYFNDISCSDIATCVAVGESASSSGIYRTVNGGKTWDQVFEQQSSIMSSLFKIRFLADGKTAYAIGGNADAKTVNGIIYVSRDGGASWKIDHKEPGVGMFVGLSMSDDGTFGGAIGITMDQTSLIMKYSA
jgi:photosystem II stability/assembly factor-like uncharacterized protein